jgi:hypothetical protein
LRQRAVARVGRTSGLVRSNCTEGTGREW